MNRRLSCSDYTDLLAEVSIHMYPFLSLSVADNKACEALLRCLTPCFCSVALTGLHVSLHSERMNQHLG